MGGSTDIKEEISYSMFLIGILSEIFFLAKVLKNKLKVYRKCSVFVLLIFVVYGYHIILLCGDNFSTKMIFVSLIYVYSILRQASKI